MYSLILLKPVQWQQIILIQVKTESLMKMMYMQFQFSKKIFIQKSVSEEKVDL